MTWISPIIIGAKARPKFWTAVVTPKAVPTASGLTTRGIDAHITAAYREYPTPSRTIGNTLYQQLLVQSGIATNQRCTKAISVAEPITV